LHIFVLLPEIGGRCPTAAALFNPNAYLLRGDPRKLRFLGFYADVRFSDLARQREWSIGFVSANSAGVLEIHQNSQMLFSAARLGCGIEVNRVRVMRRGWDALNMNFAVLFVNSEALAVYIGFQAKNGHLSID